MLTYQAVIMLPQYNQNLQENDDPETAEARWLSAARQALWLQSTDVQLRKGNISLKPKKTPGPALVPIFGYVW